MKQTFAYARIAAVVVLIVVMAVVSGCGSQKVTAIALMVDPTETARYKRQNGLEYMKRILEGGYLPKGSRLAIIRVDCDPVIVWSGEVHDKDEILKAYEEALQGKNCGTDPWKALDMANQWLQEPAQSKLDRKICTGWIDCVQDPCKSASRIKTFAEPEAYKWPGAKLANVEVYLFGVNQDRQSNLKRAWSSALVKQPELYGPGERIRPETIGLNRGTVL